MFQRFLIRVLIERAILFEEQAYRFYEALLKRSIMKDSFDLIKKLMAEELRHRITLEEVGKRREVKYLNVQDGKGKNINDLFSVEPQVDEKSLENELLDERIKRYISNLDELDETGSPWTDFTMLATSKEILEFALHKERCAFNFYTSLCRKRKLKTVRDVFCALSRAEQRHLEWILSELEAFR